MWEKVGIIRSEKDLKEALKKLNALRKELPDKTRVSPLLHRTRSIVGAARLITLAAFARKKSLGSHVIREDFQRFPQIIKGSVNHNK